MYGTNLQTYWNYLKIFIISSYFVIDNHELYIWNSTDKRRHKKKGKGAPLCKHWGSVQAVRPAGRVEVLPYSFLTTALEGDGGFSVTPRPLFTSRKDPVPIVQEAGWTPGPVWTGAENLVLTGILSPDRPARSKSLYRLSYPAHKRRLKRR